MASSSAAQRVQASRAGDRFHYVWAATQCLQLLDVRSGLVDVFIEGAATPVLGEEIIDIAYRFTGVAKRPARALVQQLKYSSLRGSENLTMSDLWDVLVKFGQVDSSAGTALSMPPDTPVEFEVVSNRPVSQAVLDAVAAVAAGATYGPPLVEELLHRLGEVVPDPATFCGRVRFVRVLERLPRLRRELDAAAGEVGAGQLGVGALLVEIVAERASGERNAPIRAEDVAVAFGTTVAALTPAPSRLTAPTHPVAREGFSTLAERVLDGDGVLLITAAGGAGKSTFSEALPRLLAGRAEVVVYDCFGAGEYRWANRSRHRDRDGLVQLASELAARGLSAPLLPGELPGREWAGRFRARLEDAVAVLREERRATRLVLVVDAADNAVIAAGEQPGDSSFIRTLLGMQPVAGVRVVLTTRPERLELLEAPRQYPRETLPEFAPAESAALLRTRFPQASDADAGEFHHVTGGNPRLQDLALQQGRSLPVVLAGLAGLPVGADPVAEFLGDRLESALADAGPRGPVLEGVARLLAVLRPRIPIATVTDLTGCSRDELVGFASDLGGGVQVGPTAVQFRDEPTETFFRARFPAGSATAASVLDEVEARADRDGYAAAVFPQLLWEAGQHARLIALATSGTALPTRDEVETRQLEQLRQQFALRAAIVLQDPPAMVELAMLAGATAASAQRRAALLADEPDLAGEALGEDVVDAVRAAGQLPSPWPGASLVAEAAMLAVQPGREAEARSRLRAAVRAVGAWVARPHQPGLSRDEQVLPEQVASVAFAFDRLDGPAAAVSYLEGWSPQSWVLDCGMHLAGRLLARGELDRLLALLGHARSRALTAAAVGRLQRAGRLLPPQLADACWTALVGDKGDDVYGDLNLDGFDGQQRLDVFARAVALTAAAQLRSGVAAGPVVEQLRRMLPDMERQRLGEPHGSWQDGLLLVAALDAAVENRPLDAAVLAGSPGPDGRDRSAQDRQEQLQPLLPWLTEWAAWVLGDGDAVVQAELIGRYPMQRSSYRDPVVLRRVAGPIAAAFGRAAADGPVVAGVRGMLATLVEHTNWVTGPEMIAVVAGQDRFAECAYAGAEGLAAAFEGSQSSADETTGDLVRLARAVYGFDEAEAFAFYGRATEVASRLGYDAGDRWRTVLVLSGLADPGDAGRLSGLLVVTAEAIAPYLEDRLDEQLLVKVLAGLVGPAALSQLSRWRDARFGVFDWQVPAAVEGLGLSQSSPEVAVLLQLCAGRVQATLLESLLAGGPLTGRAEAVRTVASAAGIQVGPLEAGRRSESVDAGWMSSVGLPLETDREGQRAELLARLAGLPLTTSAGMTAAAAVLSGAGRDVEVLAGAVAALTPNRWAAAISAFTSASGFTGYQRSAFLQTVDDWTGLPRAARATLTEAARRFVVDNAVALLTGWGFGGREAWLERALGGRQEVLLAAAAAVDVAEATASAERCYRLAEQTASLLSPGEAGAAALQALGHLGLALGLEPAVAATAMASVEPTAMSPVQAAAGVMWALAGDPQEALRWRAARALRFGIEFGVDGFVAALLPLVVAGRPEAFLDPRLPFYDLAAADVLVVAAARAAVTSAGSVLPLLPGLQHLRVAAVDHWTIQRGLDRIVNALAAAGYQAEADYLAVGGFPIRDPVRYGQVPPIPKPYGSDRVEAEFWFPFDFDEHWAADVTRAFAADHGEVLQEMSRLILDEWGWRGDPAVSTDPRRMVGAYVEEETFFTKHEAPSALNLPMYLSVHALLTVAGRLAGRRAPAADEDGTARELSVFVDRFELTRADGFWVTDARVPVPPALGHAAASERDWRWSVKAADFVAALFSDPGWITVTEHARQVYFDRYDTVSVRSWLVPADTAPALLRALQTAPSLQYDGVPWADVHEGALLEDGPFRIRGWVDLPLREGGRDRSDPIAAHLQWPLPGFSSWLTEAAGLRVDPLGATWVADDGAMVARAQTWAEKEPSGRRRESNGPSGYRLQVSAALLERVASITGDALVVEVGLKRDDFSDVRRSAEQQWESGEYVRYFCWDPGRGWRDYLGGAVTG